MKYAPSYIARILFNYFSDELTPEEEVVLNEWAAESEANRRLLEELSDPVQFMRKWERHNRMNAERSWKELQERAPDLFRFNVDDRKTGSFIAVVFARVKNFFSRLFDLPGRRILQLFLVLVFVGGLIGLNQIFRNRAPVSQTLPQTDVNAALSLTLTGPSATLQVAGGPVLKLDSVSRGMIGESGFAKTDSNQLTWKGAVAWSVIPPQLVNSGELPTGDETWPPKVPRRIEAILSTPAGALYTVVLPDGTIVTLNAASKLSIPDDYGMPERTVDLEGEAYFEVSRDKQKQPFTVHTNGVQVVCLSTRFVVKAYKDGGPTVATLEEGSIQMVKGTQKLVLDSSQPTGVVDKNGKLIRDDAAVANSLWKAGRFEFTGVPADRILQELSRWYGKKIMYDDHVPTEAENFYGSYTEPFDSTVGHLAQIVPFSYRPVAGGIRVLH